MRVTVQELLSAGLFADSKIIAGEKGLNRVVTSLNIMDSHRGCAFAEPGMFAITSGYFLSQMPTEQAAIIARLCGLGVAGIALKSAYFNYQVPEKIVRIANELDFPVIELANDSSPFRDFFVFFGTQVYARGLGQFLSREDVTAGLIRIMHEEGLPGLARQLYVWTGLPMAALFRDELYGYPSGDSPFRQYLSRYDAVQQCLDDPAAPDLLKLDGPQPGLGVTLDFQNGIVGAIWLDGATRPGDENDVIFLRAAKLAAELDIRQILEFQKDVLRQKSEFIALLLSGQLRSWSEAAMMAKVLNWRIPRQVSLLLISCENEPGICAQLEAETIAYFQQKQLSILVYPYEQSVAVFLPGDLEDAPEQVRDLQRHLNQVYQGKTLLLALGHTVPLQCAHASYQQARFTMEIGRHIHPQQTLFYYDRLGLFRLGCPEAPEDVLYQLCREMMLPLLESDSILKLDLLQTLRVYFRTGGNFSHTGQKLFVHHNTVRYRLEVVERLSKMRFDSYYEMLGMQVALALLPIFFPEYRNLLPEEI